MRCRRRSKNVNILLVGASGVGKTSFIQTVAGSEVESLGELAEHQVVLSGCPMRLYDFRGYGSQSNVQEKFAKIDMLVRESYKKFLLEETKIDRDPFLEDGRIHLLVLFSSPANKGMKDYDITLLRMMNKKVNTLVVIPKCDYYTAEELQSQKRKISELLKTNNIDTFGVEESEDATIFALFSAEKTAVNGPAYTERTLPLGTASITNEEHSDYSAFLRLLETSHEDLIELTHTHFYEKYRAAMLGE